MGVGEECRLESFNGKLLCFLRCDLIGFFWIKGAKGTDSVLVSLPVI